MKSYRNCTNFKDLQMLLKGIGRYMVKQYEEEVEKKNRRQKADFTRRKTKIPIHKIFCKIFHIIS